MEPKNRIRGALGLLVSSALLIGLTAGAADAEHQGKSRVKTRVYSSQQRSSKYKTTQRGHAYGHNKPKPRPGGRQSTDDFDRDGIPNHRDRDDDNDGVSDSRDRNDFSSVPVRRTATSLRNDLDRDGIPDSRDRDIDNDGRRNENDKYPRDRRRH